MQRQKKLICWCLFFCAVIGGARQHAEPIGVIKAIGRGVASNKITNPAQAKIMARRAAKVNALRNLLAKIKGVLPQQADGKLEEYVQGIIAGHRYGPYQVKDGIVTVEVSLPIAEVLSTYYRLLVQLENCTRQWEQSQRENTRLTKQLTESTLRIETLRTEKSAQSARLQTSQKQIEQQNAQIEKLQKQIEQQNAQIEQQNAQIEKLQKQIEQQNAQIEKLQKQILSLQSNAKVRGRKTAQVDLTAAGDANQTRSL